ncbi:hypothetical protein Tco_0285833 [Tanacetum coccineum]
MRIASVSFSFGCICASFVNVLAQKPTPLVLLPLMTWPLIERELKYKRICVFYTYQPLSRNYKARNSLYGSGFDNRAKCLIAVDGLPHEADNVYIWAWNGDLGIEEEVVTCKLYLGLAFTILTLERMTIGCCEVGGGGGGGGGVIGRVGVVCSDGVDNRVGGVICGVVCGFVCGVVKAPISTMIVSVPEKDRWCGYEGQIGMKRDVIVDGGEAEIIKNRENVRMILDSVLSGPLVWPTVVQEDGTTRKKKYEELLAIEKIQADCDLKATNISVPRTNVEPPKLM